MADTKANEVVRSWLQAFSSSLEKCDVEAAMACFAEDCYWRDLVSFTWNLKTMEGRGAIGDMLSEMLDVIKPSNWLIDGNPTSADGITEAWLTFETDFARGKGHVRLNSEGCWTILTASQDLKGYEEKKGATREKGVQHGAHKGRQSWLEKRQQESRELGFSTQPYVLIVGGGQGGIILGARLQRLGVPTIIVEKNERAGDSWRRRYKSLCLHDPVWYDHLPYLPFPDHWPIFSPKDKLGDWLEMYTKVMELNYWTSTLCKSASYDPLSSEWIVTVDRDGDEVVLRPKQLVLATGMSGVPNIPDVGGLDIFKGHYFHSSQFPGGDDYSGKKAVVVGSNNSAHDICADLWENGAHVTMLQRSTTHVSRSETLMEIQLGKLYSEEAVANGITTEIADMMFASIPYAVLPAIQKLGCDEIRKRDADFYQRLEDAGFMLDFGADETGLFQKYLRRGSGYYIDVGASELVANGSIKLAHGQITALFENGVLLEDGTELPADIVIFATGYGSMNGWAAQLISQDVADKVGKCWGLGSNTPKDPGPWEGELRNMWKPTQQEALWFHGGNLHQSRHYSQYLAIQLKAREVGIKTPVYGLQKVYHKS